MMKVPTIEDFVDSVDFDLFCQGAVFSSTGYTRQSVIDIAKNFAKLHVEAALEEAAKNVCIDWDYIDILEGNCEKLIDKQSILNAYPLKNVK